MAKGFSQVDLDQLMNFAIGTTGRWERSDVTPLLKHRKKLARKLGVSVEELGFEQGDQP